MTDSSTPAEHECVFPLQPPEGSISAPGPCRVCGTPYLLLHRGYRTLDGRWVEQDIEIHPMGDGGPLRGRARPGGHHD